MVRENEIRDGELSVNLPPANDAGLVFIGRIRTPWTSRLMTPRHGRPDGPACRIEIFERWKDALEARDVGERRAVLRLDLQDALRIRSDHPLMRRVLSPPPRRAGVADDPELEAFGHPEPLIAPDSTLRQGSRGRAPAERSSDRAREAAGDRPPRKGIG